jgi:U3 small nucleolar RNA-associated protein 3
MMAKKRKAGGRPFGDDEPRREREGNSKLRINTYEDVADSEDEFHINRDKILLEEDPAHKRQRKAQEEGLFCLTMSKRSFGG